MNTGLHPVDAIRFTTQGDYACSWCGYRIPTKRQNGDDVLQEWSSADVAGLFCSESHAIAATNNITYRERWSWK